MTDPVDAHVAALARRLRGPARLRRSMLAETRSGLLDAADAHRDAAVAVAEFGTVAEIAPDFQAELTAAQGRRTALLVAVLFPVLMVGWDLLWRAGLAWSGPGTAEVRALSGLQDVASIVVACLAGLVALAGLRRRPDPRPITVAAAVVGLVGAMVCGTTAVTMNLRNPETPTLLATNPVVTAALVLSGAALVAILSTTVRSLRVALHRPADR